jgi:HSP20 family protein
MIMAKGQGKKEVTPRTGEVQRVTPAPGRALSPFEEMDRMFESFFPRRMRPFRWETPLWSELAAPLEAGMPRIDVIDRDDEVVVRAEIPGVDKKDLDISVDERHVTIKGSTAREEKEEKGDYYRSEIMRGAFARTITLPSEVNGEKARAKFSNGLLELSLPKVERSKRHSIKVE